MTDYRRLKPAATSENEGLLAMTKKERNIHYFKIEYAKRGLALCEGENLSMKDCAFTNNETGLKLRGNSDVSVKDCVFKGNVNSGILVGENVSGTIKDDSLYDNGIGINIQGLHTFKSPLIPLFQRGNLSKSDRGDFTESGYQIASKVNNKGILAMTPLSRHCEPEGRGNLILTESKNDQQSGNILCPELVLKGLYVSGNNTGMLFGGVSTPEIKETKIINNIDYGVYITDNSEPNLGGSGHNCIYGSGTYDLYNNTSKKIMAKKNYWGTVEVDSVELHIYDYYDDNFLGIVEIEPLWNGSKAAEGTMSSGIENRFIYSLKYASPNPFTENTEIMYSIAHRAEDIELNIYDITGRLVKTLVHGKKDAGVYRVKWNGNDNNNRKVATGVYFTRLVSNDFTSVKKVILVR